MKWQFNSWKQHPLKLRQAERDANALIVQIDALIADKHKIVVVASEAVDFFVIIIRTQKPTIVIFLNEEKIKSV